jgi:hypothetical protein
MDSKAIALKKHNSNAKTRDNGNRISPKILLRKLQNPMAAKTITKQ